VTAEGWSASPVWEEPVVAPARAIAPRRLVHPNRLSLEIGEAGAVPLCWSGSTEKMDYLNLGDAFAPMLVAALTGRGIERVPMRSVATRLAGVGYVAHGLAGGETFVWGAGCGTYRTEGGVSVPYQRPPDTAFRLFATRGPLSAHLMGEENWQGRRPVYGDPVWLLPRLYRPDIPKRYELGVVLHLSELADRAFTPHPLPEFRRFEVPEELQSSVRLLHTVVPIDPLQVQARIDDILACKRIVSMSFHGLVIAETYGIPCLFFAPTGGPQGAVELPLSFDQRAIDHRFVDYYMGLGRSRHWVYSQRRDRPTDWGDVIAAVDRVWQPAAQDEEALLDAFPLDLAPLATGPTDLFRHPLMHGLPFRSSVQALRQEEAVRRAVPRA